MYLHHTLKFFALLGGKTVVIVSGLFMFVNVIFLKKQGVYSKTYD
jgi:hypothetical protein